MFARFLNSIAWVSNCPSTSFCPTPKLCAIKFEGIYTLRYTIIWFNKTGTFFSLTFFWHVQSALLQLKIKYYSYYENIVRSASSQILGSFAKKWFRIIIIIDISTSGVTRSDFRLNHIRGIQRKYDFRYM